MIPYDVILSPLITEKNTCGEKNGKYVFKVNKKANKTLIKHAINKIYAINIKTVNIINVKGKRKVFKGKNGVRASFKKAFVTTSSKKRIDLFRVNN